MAGSEVSFLVELFVECEPVKLDPFILLVGKLSEFVSSQ